MKRSTLLLALVGSSLLAGCSTMKGLFGSTPVNYQNTTQINKLEVPPDLTTPNEDNHFEVPAGNTSGTTTWSAYSASRQQENRAMPAAGTAAVGNAAANSSAQSGESGTPAKEEVLPPPPEGVTLERDGCERWLVINQPAEKVWSVLLAFWKDNDFKLAESNAKLGVMQTDWKQNANRLPQDFIHSTLGKVLPSLYSSDERDAYRVRLERDAAHPERTEIYLTETAITQVYDNSIDGLHTQWQRAPSDPGAEAIMLGRIMERFGVPKAKAKSMLAAPAPTGLAHLTQPIQGNPVLVDQEPFDRAWRRVGLALDRSGYNVVDRDRNKGIYFVTEGSTNVDTHATGFWSKLEFWKRLPDNVTQYQVELDENASENSTDVRILDNEGKTAAKEVATRILNRLYDQLK